ncbi:MAG TPA: hypothetical protein VLB69_06675 [Rudaea sp.]|nr:hypothetical protein [Rudaea sp.]
MRSRMDVESAGEDGRAKTRSIRPEFRDETNPTRWPALASSGQPVKDVPATIRFSATDSIGHGSANRPIGRRKKGRPERDVPAVSLFFLLLPDAPAT